jgi:hypothetical protein
MSRINLFLVSLVVLIATGVFGLKMVEPTATWSDAARWTMMAFSTFGVDMFPPTNGVSSWFQTLFLLASFLETGFALTIIIPPFNEWWEAPKKGLAEAKYRKGVPLYLLVGPVDWEKVESVYREMQRALGHVHLVVVVSETLTEIPAHLRKLGVQFVNGSLRRIETYRRAGLDHATGAFVCSGSYNDTAADINTAAVAGLIERFRAEVHTIVEVVSRENADLFAGEHAVNQSAVFDPLTLAAVAQNLAAQVNEQLKGQPVHVIGLPEVEPDEEMVTSGNLKEPLIGVDSKQRDELRRQLHAAGVILRDDGVPVQIILPDDLDNPVASDAKVWAALKRATAKIVVAMYCSIVSDDLFSGKNNAVCADRIMAQALVGAHINSNNR